MPIRNWAASPERRGQHPSCVRLSCPQPFPPPAPLTPEVQSGEEAGPAPGAGGEAAPRSTLMKSFLLLQALLQACRATHAPTPASLVPPLLYPQAAPHLEVKGLVLSTPVHPQTPFCLQLRGVWSQGIWSEGSARVKGCNLSRAPALPPHSLYLLSSGQCPSPAGFGLTSISLLLYLPCSSAQEGRWAGSGRPWSPACSSTPS